MIIRSIRFNFNQTNGKFETISINKTEGKYKDIVRIEEFSHGVIHYYEAIQRYGHSIRIYNPIQVYFENETPTEF